MDDGFNTSHLQYINSTTSSAISISDWDVQHPTNANQIRYFLSAIDKMHDFESVYKAAIPNIRTTHFNVVDGNATKWINATENASTKLTASAGTLQQIIDFKSYIKSVAMEGAAPQLTIGTSSFNYADKAPFTMHTMNVSSDLGEYKTLLPPTRDCFISLRGTAAEFETNAGRIRDLLNVGEGGAYVSKDAFPLDSETVSKIFRAANGNDKFPFGSYLSQLLDPATETKIIIPVSKQVTIQALYCVLSGDRRLFIEINMQPGGGERNAKIKFGISSAGPAINWSAAVPAITINNKTPIPSIQDCVVWMLGNNTKTLKKTGAKIWNALKTGNLKQNTQAAEMDGYFTKILTNIENNGAVALSPEDKDLIAIASKTNGDQSYKWDQLIADGLGYQTSLHGTYKVTVDYYEFLDDVHSKQVNSVFASKSGRSLTTGRSIYTMTIYLKPLSEEAAKEFIKDQEKAQAALVGQIAGLRTENVVDNFVGLMSNFVTKLTELLAEFQTRFTGYVPVDENSRKTNYRYGNQLNPEYESQQIANQYYSACQIVLDHLGKIWSLNKAIDKINMSVANDLPTLQLLISAKNAYDDAAAYSVGFATAANGAFTTDLTEWTKQGSGIDSVVNSFNHQIGTLSKNTFPISNVVPVKGLYGLSKPTIIGWFIKIGSEFNMWKSKNGMQGGARSSYKPIKTSFRPDFFNNKLFANQNANKSAKTVAIDGKTVKVVQTTQPTKQFIDIKSEQQARKLAQQAVIDAISQVTTPEEFNEFKKEIAKVPQLGEMLGSYINYMGDIDLRDVNDVYACDELFSYIKYILEVYYSTSDIFYECVFYIILKLAPDYAFSIYTDGRDESTFPTHHTVWDAAQMASPNYPLYHPSSHLTKYDGGGKKTSRRNARRTIKKRTNKMHKRTKRNRTQN